MRGAIRLAERSRKNVHDTLSDGSIRRSSLLIAAKVSKCGSADKMALDVNGIVDRSVGCEKSLS